MLCNETFAFIARYRPIEGKRAVNLDNTARKETKQWFGQETDQKERSRRARAVKRLDLPVFNFILRCSGLSEARSRL